jgi:choline dehydrogenase-like flavoprotein
VILRQKHEVLVIGSGPVGIGVACRLAKGGLQVTVLEAGSAITEPPGSHIRNQRRYEQDPDGYFRAIEKYLSPVTDPEKTSPLPGAAESSLLGGQGILWTNNCPRAAEFERWEVMSPGEWEQRYAEAESILQVLPAPSANSSRAQRIRKRLQEALGDQQRTISDLPFSGEISPSGEIYYNGPADIMAAATDDVRRRIAIHSGVRVTRLNTTGSRATGLEIETADNDRASLEAATIFVAGGAIETPRLLHRSGIRPTALGRGISFHVLLFGQVVLETALCPANHGSDLAPRFYIPPTVDTPWQVMLLRDTCPLPATEKIADPNRLLEFQAFLPVEFRDENVFVIHDDANDEFRFEFSRADRDRMLAMEEDVQALARQLGRWRRGCEPTWIPHGNAHIVGTCRMDRPGWQGVADTVGRVHGFDNLYLVSVGLFPAPVAENPTLSALALAMKSCDHLVS